MFPNQMIKPGIFSKGLNAAKGINWSGILDGTQKTLGIINQAIPIVYQVKPIINNAKTMFKIANVINEPSAEKPIQNTNSNIDATINKPIFYI